MKGIKSKALFDYISSIFFLGISIVALFPLYWMFAGSFMTDLEVTKTPPIIFSINPYFGNYIEAFTRSPVFRWFFNSVLVSSVTTTLVILISTMAGYSFAKKKFFARDIIFIILVMTMMIPKQILIIPLFKIVQSLDMFNTYGGMIIPTLGWPIGIFLMRQFMVSIPDEIIEASVMDGCPELTLYSRIIVPLVIPGIGALAIFTFTRTWNDYMWQLLIISSKVMRTLPLGVASFQEEFSRREGLLLTGAVIASLPMMIVFIRFQKYFTKGITVGAVKG